MAGRLNTIGKLTPVMAETGTTFFFAISDPAPLRGPSPCLHFRNISIAPAQGSAALAEEKQPVWIFRAAGLMSGSSCVEVVQLRQHLEKVAPLAKVLNAKPEVFDPMDV